MERLPGSFLDEFHLVGVENEDGGFIIGWNPDAAWVCPQPISFTPQENARDLARRIGRRVLLLLREDIKDQQKLPVFRIYHILDQASECWQEPRSLGEGEQRSASALLSFLMLQKVWPEAAERCNAEREMMGLSRIDPVES